MRSRLRLYRMHRHMVLDLSLLYHSDRVSEDLGKDFKFIAGMITDHYKNEGRDL